ncbi:S41 family peptidase [Flavobacterium sp. FlaQc-48]|uniref:S41 family peptidase n=1 Tax=Flavobacterium sp. FlaQc-48 TaxID=3374181 RepID=UPI003757681D
MTNFLKLIFTFWGCSLTAAAQNPAVPLTYQEKKQVIDSVAKKLTNIYIYPEVAKKMASVLLANYKRGDYDAISEPSQFAGKLAANLLEVSSDRHINVTFDPSWVEASKKAESKKDSLELLARDFPNARSDNFGFRKLTILEGNIGYLNLTRFYDPGIGGETATSAMNFLSNTDALIIDLRQNEGGRADMVQLLSSYFFDQDPVMITDIYSREDNQHRQDWTLPYLPGRRMPEKPLYLLVGKGTFSAAESLSYFLKNRKRAVLIGQPTGGGAHPVQHKMLTDRFSIFIPYALSIDPITKTDWEGSGVIPNISVPEKEALLFAHMAALEELLKNQSHNISTIWALEMLKARLNPVVVPQTLLKSYTGSYGAAKRKLTYEKGKLYVERAGEPKYELIPITCDTFHIPETPYLRIKINLENGKAVSLTRQYNEGTSIKDLKN